MSMSRPTHVPAETTGQASPSSERVEAGLTGRRWQLATFAAFLLALLISVPTTGDLGLTWDEPAYRFSQVRSAQWWERLAHARSRSDLAALTDSHTLLFYWPYARHGINFHPPLSGQLNLLTHVAFGRWMNDTASRRMASVIELSLAVTLLFGFLARRYGAWVGGIAAGALLLMPRVYGDGHLAATDIPGLLLWPAIALAFWKGLDEPRARRWRVAVGFLLGLAFLQKMATVFVLLPLIVWLVLTRLDRARSRGDWIDGVLTTGAMLLPLVAALLEILRLARQLPQPRATEPFGPWPTSPLPGVVLAFPLLLWVARRILGWAFPRSPVWGVERPGLETFQAILAFAPVVGWLGCPPWWRETLPRLAHYYLLNTDRRGSLPDIQIFYLGQTYEYSLPWHNAWLLMAVTIPAASIVAGLLGLAWSLGAARRDRLPLYFVVQFLTLPFFRMLPTPAHDGIRLFLPTFFFFAAMVGWGAVWVARGIPARRAWVPRAWVAALVLGPSAWQLASVHPYELSYYNEFIGGAPGAWGRGLFELTYWYDAFNRPTLAELNNRLPPNAQLAILNDKSETAMPVFTEHQSLGELRSDLQLGWVDDRAFPYGLLLTQDSKASAFTRLLFTMTPWYASTPRQLGGARVVTVASPEAVARAWALWLLTDAPDTLPPEEPRVPEWVRNHAPFLGRFWGEGLTRVARLNAHEPTFTWARSDPASLLRAARLLAEHRGQPGDDPEAQRLRAILDRYPQFVAPLFKTRPEALVEAVQILVDHPDAVLHVVKRYPYTEPAAPDLRYLDAGLASEPPPSVAHPRTPPSSS